MELINDIVDISKIEAGQLEIYNTPVNIDKIVIETYSFFTQIAKSKGIALKLKNDPKGKDLIANTDPGLWYTI